MAQPLTRTRVGRFELIHRFAIGGMGEIFLARERGVAGFDRRVVVKLLIPELAEQPDLVTMFIDEARIAANLAHPNIVQIFDFGRDEGAYFLAMEHVPGQNLARICSRAVRDPRGLLTRNLAVHVVAEMARGLEYAHRARDTEGKPLGIVHRDVSPHNLLLSIHGDVKVMDFGIAKAANTLHRTATGVVRGKFGYMSPEQLAGESVDVATDVYSAGIVLWELTLMRRLWPGDELAVLDQARKGKIPRPTEIDPSYPADLEEIVMHAIARDRSQRTRSAGALESDLRGWLALQGAVIERSQLGAVVKELFPEIDHETPMQGAAAEQPPHTVSLPQPTTTTTPASPAAAPAAARRTARGGKRGALIAFAAIAAAAGGVFAVTRYTDRDPPARVAAASGAADAPPAIATSEPDASTATTAGSAVGSDAGSAAVVDAGSGSAVVVAPKRKPPKKTEPKHEPKHHDPEAGSATVTVAPPPAPETGLLIVEATPWGTVAIPGHAPEQTPQRYHLAPGEYAITVTIAEGGGTVRGTATVTSNGTTKCRGTASGLTCGR